MLDIQSRVSNLERSSSTIGEKIGDGAPYDKTKYASSESQTWWEACQNFARNCDTPFSANEFLRTPRRFSGFDFHFDAFKSRPRTPPLTPEEEADGMQNNTPSASFNPKPRGSNEHSNDNVLERVPEFDKTRILTPPNLQTPPGSVHNKSLSVLSVEADITALPELPTEPAPPLVAERSQRSYKGIKRMFTYKALLKSKGSEEEHPTFLHFNRKASGSKKSVSA
ncbi:hypothetical protein N0V83_009597 [Neocucurbitaria cava]|uniref:Uncharacterized protein n=1 Tax=Neocucurbitaria cava TaxID=798079 RepID=A0A9W9CHP8_9PLEO|nr:hypothetical protein N0V83_009597 [Neocucurbitaria cava]